MQVSPSVRAVQVPDDDPMHTQMTSIYVVGKDQVLSIDSGEELERFRWMLRGYLAAVERAEIALAGITHHHLDHSGNLKWIREHYNADILVHAEGVPLLEEQLPDAGVKMLSEGQVIDLGSTKVRVLATPGHSIDSVCYYIEDEGVLFTGDTMLGSTSTTVWDLSMYMATLQRLQTLPNLEVICPGHGPLIHDPRERIQGYIDHRNKREQQIVQTLAEQGEQTSWDIMLKMYPEIDTRLRFAANINVETHLTKLEREGRLKAHGGKAKVKSPEELRRAEEHAHERAEVIAKGKQYEKEDRQALIATMENPPTETWEVPPTYELIGRPGE